MKVLELKDELFIGKGNERICFLHPKDPKKVIKVKYNNINGRNQNIIEYRYYNHLKKNKVDFSHIAKFYGSVNTDKGEGLVFERIENYDNTSVLTLADAIKEKILEYHEVKALLNELYLNIKDNQIVFTDIGFDNIVCRKNEDKSWSLVIIDGLGTRHTGFKLWLSMNSTLYARYKVYRQFSKLLSVFYKNFSALEN